MEIGLHTWTYFLGLGLGTITGIVLGIRLERKKRR
jgi:hypothetical protein